MLARLVLVLLAEVAVGVVMSGVRPLPMRAESRPDTFRLVSAQVVTTAGDRPPLLRLAANGPIAFRVLTAEESGLPQGSQRVAVRLYGVLAGDVESGGGLAPFSMVVTPASDGGSGGAGAGASASDTMINVGLAGLAPDAALRVRAGQRANELEIIPTMP